MVERIVPTAALVVHILLNERECRAATVLREVLDAARHRNAVGELNDVGEIAADLDLRIHPRLQAPVGLDEHPVAERDNRVAALRARHRRRQRGDVRSDQPCERVRRLEVQASARRLELHAFAYRGDQRTNEGLVAERIREHADLCLLPSFGDREAAQRAHQAIFPGEGERQEIGLRFVTRALHARQRDQPASVSRLPLDMIGDLDAPHRLAFPGIPAAPADELRQHLAFELLANLFRQGDAPRHDAVAEQARPTVEQNQHGKLLARQ